MEGKIDYGEIEAVLNQVMETPLSFETLVFETMEKGVSFSFVKWAEILGTVIRGQLQDHGRTIGYLLVLLLSSAILSSIAKAFRNRQISDMGFYMIFLLMILILLKSFGVCYDVTAGVIKDLVDFMRVLMPAYLMAAAMGAYRTTAVMYYEGFLILIYYLQKIMEHVLLPAVRAYFLISMVGYLGNEDYFSKGREGIKKLILWLSKGMIAVTAGAQMIQGMISPAIDEMKHTIFQKGISSLGSLGNVTQNVTDVILGSGELLKNGIGAAAAVIIVSICLIPVIEVGIYVIFYQVLGILAEPISDKRLLGIVGEAGVASGLLVKLLFTVCAMFLLTIALVCVTTGGML